MDVNYRYRPLRYFTIVGLITWAASLTAAWYSYQLAGPSNRLFMSLFIYIGILTPFCAAVWLVFTSGNAELKRDFLNRVFNFKRIRIRYIPAILLIVPAIATGSILLSTLVGEPRGQFGLVRGAIYATGAIPAPFILFGAALFEELGWKGYAMDSLRSKFNFFNSCLVFSLFWIFWHLPLFFIDDFYCNILWKTSLLYTLNYCVSIAATGFLTCWAWYKNKGCILAAVLVHASANFQGIFQMGQIAKCIETVLMIGVIIIIVFTNKEMYFSKPSGKIGQFNE